MSSTQIHARWYHKARLRLIMQMGGSCGSCGRYDKIELHHIRCRDWEPRQTSRLMRIIRYRKEWMEGELKLLCRSCNAEIGKP